MAAQKCNHVSNVTNTNKRKTINFAYEFLLINTEYNKVSSLFFCADSDLRRFRIVRILLRKNVLCRFCGAKMSCADSVASKCPESVLR